MISGLELLGLTLVHSCWQAAIVAFLYCAIDLTLAKNRNRLRALLSMGALVAILASAIVTLCFEAANLQQINMGSHAPASAIAFSFQSRPEVPYNPPAATHTDRLQLPAFFPWIDGLWLLGVLFFSVRTVGGWFWLQRVHRGPFLPVPQALSAMLATLCRRLSIARIVDLRISERIANTVTIGALRAVIFLPASALLAITPDQLEAVLAHELEHIRRADYLGHFIQTTIETLFFFHPAVWWIGKRLRLQRELCCDEAAVCACANPLLYAQALLCMEEQRQRSTNLAMALHGNQPHSALITRMAIILGEPPFPENARRSRFLPTAAFCLAGGVILAALSSYPRASAIPENARGPWVEQTSALRLSVPARDSSAVAALVQPSERSASRTIFAETDPQQMKGRSSQDSGTSVNADDNAEHAQKIPRSPTDLYRVWSDEDVRWIISDAELKAYGRLSTNQERDEFIRQFWQRRAPTSTSFDNPFREEHYRRIAYANVHFAAKQPGWLSDRGHIYIVYGPPDSLESHPSGGLSNKPTGGQGKASFTSPFEIWHYRHIDQIGDNLDLVFVDSCSCGQYIFTIQPTQRAQFQDNLAVMMK